MSKTLIRLVSLLIIPCLLADPVMATAFITPPSSLIQPSPTSLFTDQALAAYLVSSLRIDRLYGVLGKIRRTFGSWFRQEFLAADSALEELLRVTGRHRFLVLEDNPDEATALKVHLEARGYLVVIARSYSEAKRYTNRSYTLGVPFTRILTDLDLSRTYAFSSRLQRIAGFLFVLWLRLRHPDIKNITLHSHGFDEAHRNRWANAFIRPIAEWMGVDVYGKDFTLQGSDARPTSPASYGQHEVTQEGLTSEEEDVLAERVLKELRDKNTDSRKTRFTVSDDTLKAAAEWVHKQITQINLSDFFMQVKPLKAACERAIELWKDPEQEFVINKVRYKFEIYAVSQEREYFPINGKRVGAFKRTIPPDVKGGVGRIQIFTRGDLAGGLHEMLEHVVLAQDPTFTAGQRHLLSLWAEVIEGSQNEELPKGLDVFVPSRIYKELLSFDETRLRAIIADEDSALQHNLKLFPAPEPRSRELLRYANRFARVLSNIARLELEKRPKKVVALLPSSPSSDSQKANILAWIRSQPTPSVSVVDRTPEGDTEYILSREGAEKVAEAGGVTLANAGIMRGLIWHGSYRRMEFNAVPDASTYLAGRVIFRDPVQVSSDSELYDVRYNGRDFEVRRYTDSSKTQSSVVFFQPATIGSKVSLVLPSNSQTRPVIEDIHIDLIARLNNKHIMDVRINSQARVTIDWNKPDTEQGGGGWSGKVNLGILLAAILGSESVLGAFTGTSFTSEGWISFVGNIILRAGLLAAAVKLFSVLAIALAAAVSAGGTSGGDRPNPSALLKQAEVLARPNESNKEKWADVLSLSREAYARALEEPLQKIDIEIRSLVYSGAALVRLGRLSEAHPDLNAAEERGWKREVPQELRMWLWNSQGQILERENRIDEAQSKFSQSMRTYEMLFVSRPPRRPRGKGREIPGGQWRALLKGTLPISIHQDTANLQTLADAGIRRLDKAAAATLEIRSESPVVITPIHEMERPNFPTPAPSLPNVFEPEPESEPEAPKLTPQVLYQQALMPLRQESVTPEQIQKAQGQVRQVLERALEVPDRFFPVYVSLEWGVLLQLHGRFTEAQAAFQEAQDLAVPMRAPIALRFQIFEAQGGVALAMGKYSEAEVVYKTAVNYAQFLEVSKDRPKGPGRIIDEEEWKLIRNDKGPAHDAKMAQIQKAREKFNVLLAQARALPLQAEAAAREAVAVEQLQPQLPAFHAGSEALRERRLEEVAPALEGAGDLAAANDLRQIAAALIASENRRPDEAREVLSAALLSFVSRSLNTSVRPKAGADAIASLIGTIWQRPQAYEALWRRRPHEKVVAVEFMAAAAVLFAQAAQFDFAFQVVEQLGSLDPGQHDHLKREITEVKRLSDNAKKAAVRGPDLKKKVVIFLTAVSAGNVLLEAVGNTASDTPSSWESWLLGTALRAGLFYLTIIAGHRLLLIFKRMIPSTPLRSLVAVSRAA